MQVELRNLKHAASLSQETEAFSATLYVNGKKLAFVSNEGTGGAHKIHIIDFENKKQWQLLRELENWAKQQPEVKSGHGDYMLPMDLDFLISIKVGELLQLKLNQKMQKRFNQKKEKNMLNHILIGKPNQDTYSAYKLPFPIDDILLDPAKKGKLVTLISEVKLALKPGEAILNTNLPAELK